MQKWLANFLKQEKPTIPRPLYTLEQENQILHDMVREIAEQRNEYRIENQRLRDEIADLKGDWNYDTSGTHQGIF